MKSLVSEVVFPTGNSDGTVEPPMFGEFKNGRGEFIGPDVIHGKAILVRNVSLCRNVNARKERANYE
jgi:hypothetical protein